MATDELVTAGTSRTDRLLGEVFGGAAADTQDAARRRRALRAILAIAVAAVLIGALHLAAAPPFAPPDETAHVAYALAVGDGELPDLRDFPDPSRIPYMVEGVSQFAANHPPLTYAVLAVPLHLGELLGVPLAGLYGARAVVLLSGGFGLVLFGLLGLALLPSRPHVGVVATGIVALIPYQLHLLGVVYNDAPAFAIIIALLLAAVLLLRRGPTTARIVAVTALAAVSANTRAVGAAVAGLCAGAAGVAGLLHTEGGAGPRLKRGLVLGLIVGGVAVATSAWFYLLNLQRYASFTGSSMLMELHTREASGRSLHALFFDRLFWRNVHSQLWGRLETFATEGPWLARELMILGRWLVLGALLSAVAWGVWAIVQGRWWQPLTAVAPWLVLALWFAALALAMVDFVQSGGGPHARYLWPALPFPVMAIALGLLALPGGRRGVPGILFWAYELVAAGNILIVFLFRTGLPGPDVGLRALAATSPAAVAVILGVVGVLVLALLGYAAWSVWHLDDVRDEPLAHPLGDSRAVRRVGAWRGDDLRVDLRDLLLGTALLAGVALQLNHAFGLGVPPIVVPVLAAAGVLVAACAASRERPSGAAA